MTRRALPTAYEMEGAFTDVSLTLRRGTPPRDVVDALDGLLARYGGLGAYDREDQLSHRFITEELRQLATMATVFPVIFLSVAALLLNVVVTRLVALDGSRSARSRPSATRRATCSRTTSSSCSPWSRSASSRASARGCGWRAA